MKSISIVTPVFNSQATLHQFVARLAAVLPTLADRYEVVLVNDGSRDQSWDAIVELAGEYPWVRGLNMMRNYGQHNAVLAGIRAARHEVIVTMDDDLQHPPEEIHKLLAKLAQGYDVVYGTPHKLQHGFWRDIASLVWRLALQGAMGVETARNLDSFRALRTKLRDAFDGYHGPVVLVDVLLTWGTTSFTHTAVEHAPRAAGVSNYTFRKLVVHMVNVITAFSTLPLRLASFVGFGFTVLGLLIFLYVVGRYLVEGGSVPGFAFLASAIALFSGAQMFALGILGEYLARMHYRLMDRPAYTVREETLGVPLGSTDKAVDRDELQVGAD